MRGFYESGAVAVAAAFALNLPESDTSASIGGDVIIVAQGSVTVRGRAVSVLEELQASGKVRALGISNHGVTQMDALVWTGAPFASNQQPVT